MSYIKNIQHEYVLSLSEQIQVQPGQVVSKTLAQNDYVSVTLFAFDKGEQIGAHDSEGDAMVQVIEGTGRFTIGGTDYVVGCGQTIVMPANVKHALYAQEAFKMLLTVVFLA